MDLPILPCRPSPGETAGGLAALPQTPRPQASHPLPMTVDEMIRGADSLMYEVKKNQKDAVVFKLCV